MSSNNRAQCAVCRREYSTTSGRKGEPPKIRKHKRGNSSCPGSSQLPQTQPTAEQSKLSAPHRNLLNSISEEKVFLQGSTTRFLPKTLVPAATKSFTSALNTIINNPESTNAWRKLLQWPIVNLLAPNGRLPRVERKRILREQLNGKTSETETRNRTIHRKPDSDDEAVARAVRTRIDSGDIHGAVRAISNDCTIVTPDLVSLEDLKAKHPQEPNPTLPATEPSASLVLSMEDLGKAIAASPAGGAPGPDGLRTTHLKQICGPAAAGERDLAMTALLSFCNLVLAGRVPSTIRLHFFGARLLAFRKKDGGLRPISVGLVIKRLISRAACQLLRDKRANLLAPIQVGLGVKCGVEASVHAVRRFLSLGEEGIVN